MSASKIFLVGAGGAVGTGARVAIESLVPAQGGFPTGLVLINLFGAFALGAVAAVASRGGTPQGTRDFLNLGVGVGFLGGFTSYSTMAVAGSTLFAQNLIAGGLFGTFALVGAGVVAAAFGHRLFTTSQRAPVVADTRFMKDSE